MNEALKRAQDEACGGAGKPVKPRQVGTNDLNQILTERGDRYGLFSGHAQISRSLKRLADGFAAERGKVLADDQQEALDMIFHKIARVLNGDPDYSDSWRDIAGYAALVADRLDGVHR